MSAAAAKRHRKRAIQDLVREVIAEALSDLLVFCRGCHTFKWPSVCHTMGCTVCFTNVSYCDDCGGEPAAIKSILCHHRWYASSKGSQMFGEAHKKAWRDMLGDEEIRAHLGVIDGGKKFREG